MFKLICTISFALALFFTQVAHALPQPAIVPRDPAAPPSTPRAAFDSTFDNPARSVSNVACADGANGLAAKYPTFSTIPSYPYIGGAWDVAWNSPNCGGCWRITNPKNGASIYMTAVGAAGHGFNLGTAAFNALNGGQKTTIDVVATKVPRSYCGIQCGL